jgi:ankyrin repeat protein
MKSDQASKLQNKADILTFICMICLGILMYLLAHLSSGMEAMYIMIPFFIVVLVHLSFGFTALIAAISTGHHLRNSWIYGYYTGVLLLTLFYSGIMGALYVAGRASIERYEFELEDKLLVAIEQNRPDEVNQLIQQGANLSYCFVWDRDHKQHSPVQLAVQKRSADIVEHLLAAGAKPDAVCSSTTRPIVTAAENLDLASIKSLISSGAIPSMPEGSVLCMAIAGGNYSLPSSEHEADAHQKRRTSRPVHEVVKLLLDGGADVNAEQIGATALQWAIAFNDLALVDLLLSAGADPDKSDGFRRAPIILAIRYNHPGIIDRLLFGSPSASIGGWTGFQALQSAADRGDSKTISLLMQAGLDLTPLLTTQVRSPGGGRPVNLADELYRALKEDNQLYFTALLTAGADINQPDENQQGRVLVSLFAADPVRLQKLLDAGADLNAKNNSGGTALHFYATCKSCADPVRAISNLIQAGADINALDGRGRTPLKAATVSRVKDTTEFLQTAGAALEVRNTP